MNKTTVAVAVAAAIAVPTWVTAQAPSAAPVKTAVSRAAVTPAATPTTTYPHQVPYSSLTKTPPPAGIGYEGQYDTKTIKYLQLSTTLASGWTCFQLARVGVELSPYERKWVCVIPHANNTP